MILTCFKAILPNHPPLPLPQSPKDCPIHLCLFCCLTDKVLVLKCQYVLCYRNRTVVFESEVTQSCLTLATPWTVAHQAPQSMEFSRQEYWSGLPFPPPGDLPDPGIEPRSPMLQADALPSEPPGKCLGSYKEIGF